MICSSGGEEGGFFAEGTKSRRADGWMDTTKVALGVIESIHLKKRDSDNQEEEECDAINFCGFNNFNYID